MALETPLEEPLEEPLELFPFQLHISNDPKKFKDYPIEEVSDWSINPIFYDDLINLCNIGIFITYDPVNYDKKQLSALLLAQYDSETKTITTKLLCSKKYKNKSSSFGQLLFCILYFTYKPKKFIIDGVYERTLSYYLHYNYEITKYDNVYTLSPPIDINNFFLELYNKCSDKCYKFISELTEEDMSCA